MKNEKKKKQRYETFLSQTFVKKKKKFFFLVTLIYMKLCHMFTYPDGIDISPFYGKYAIITYWSMAFVLFHFKINRIVSIYFYTNLSSMNEHYDDILSAHIFICLCISALLSGSSNLETASTRVTKFYEYIVYYGMIFFTKFYSWSANYERIFEHLKEMENVHMFLAPIR